MCISVLEVAKSTTDPYNTLYLATSHLATQSNPRVWGGEFNQLLQQYIEHAQLLPNLGLSIITHLAICSVCGKSII